MLKAQSRLCMNNENEMTPILAFRLKLCALGFKL
jgi:hypothetical protein